MTPQEVIDLFRSTVFDTAEPYLWTDDEALDYLNDAQRMLCRNSYGINDATTDDVTLIDASAGDVFVPVDDRIMKIKTAQRLSDNRFVTIYNIEDLQGGGVVWPSDYGIQHNARLDDTQGEVFGLVLGMTDGQARLVHIPNQDVSFRLAVERLPLADIKDPSKDALEVRSEHHRHLIWWMAALAYTKQDAETFDKNKSAEFEARFMAYCDKARKERERREHKTRVVAYGGYTW